MDLRAPSHDDYIWCADQLKCSPVIIKSLSIQESNEDSNAIRWEKHVWKRYRLASKEGKRFDRRANDRDMNKRWKMFDEMDAVCKLDAEIVSSARYAAIKSHSFSWCQIMGFNHRQCDWESPIEWFSQMQSVKGQRQCLVSFIQSSPILLKGFQNVDLPTIAHHYNGPAYKRNKYDLKLARHIRNIGGVHAEIV